MSDRDQKAQTNSLNELSDQINSLTNEVFLILLFGYLGDKDFSFASKLFVFLVALFKEKIMNTESEWGKGVKLAQQIFKAQKRLQKEYLNYFKISRKLFRSSVTFTLFGSKSGAPKGNFSLFYFDMFISIMLYNKDYIYTFTNAIILLI